MFLITYYPSDCTPQSVNIINYVLHLNVSYPLFDQIIIFSNNIHVLPDNISEEKIKWIPFDNGIPCFLDYINYINTYQVGTLGIITSIFNIFDQTLNYIYTMDLQHTIIILNDYFFDRNVDRHTAILETSKFKHCSLIFRTPLRKLSGNHIDLDEIIDFYKELGYHIENPSITIRTYSFRQLNSFQYGSNMQIPKKSTFLIGSVSPTTYKLKLRTLINNMKDNIEISKTSRKLRYQTFYSQSKMGQLRKEKKWDKIYNTIKKIEIPPKILSTLYFHYQEELSLACWYLGKKDEFTDIMLTILDDLKNGYLDGEWVIHHPRITSNLNFMEKKMYDKVVNVDWTAKKNVDHEDLKRMEIEPNTKYYISLDDYDPNSYWALEQMNPTILPNPKKCYRGQLLQDKWVIEEVFKNDSMNRYYVDIGAHEGIDLSNTYILEKEYGWKGICIEALPNLFEILQKNRPNAQCISTCLYDEETELEFQMGSGRDLMLSGVKKSLDFHRPQGDVLKIKTELIGNVFKRCNCPKIIDYISLDIEGAEYNVLKKFPFTEYKVLAWTIEHNYVVNKRLAIRELLESNGYQFVKEVQHDDYYVHSSLNGIE